MRAFDFHPEAESDINAIWDYIAEDSPDAADRTIDKIAAAIEALALDDAPIEMRLPVLPPFGLSQEHGERIVPRLSDSGNPW